MIAKIEEMSKKMQKGMPKGKGDNATDIKKELREELKQEIKELKNKNPPSLVADPRIESLTEEFNKLKVLFQAAQVLERALCHRRLR